MIRERRSERPPLFSVCIPQYNRVSFLLKGLASFKEQTLQDFEVCISDDCSTEGRGGEVLDYLERNGFAYAYQWQDRGLRYDGNLRAALALARGTYCLLMGNDDALADPRALEDLAADMRRLGPAGVVITDFEDYATGRPAGRIRSTGNRGAGPAVAAAHFRNFSFVSGVVLEREPAQRFATPKWDGGEMYQMFIGCRMIASGSPLLELRRVLVRKDVRVEGEVADSYALRPRVRPCPVVERPLPLGRMGRLTADAVAPYAGERRRELNEKILRQLLQFTYPFWLVEYRRVQSWRFAAGVALGMRPARVAEGVELGRAGRWRLRLLYLLATAGGLLVPRGLFTLLQGPLYRLAKKPRGGRPALPDRVPSPAGAGGGV